jgi:hypothetical protein
MSVLRRFIDRLLMNALSPGGTQRRVDREFRRLVRRIEIE